MDRLGQSIRHDLRRVRRQLSAAVFDRRHGLETSHPVALTTLGLAQEHRVGYQPSGWLDLRRALRYIDGTRDDVFLDLGSGKGRIVLQAVRYPFKRVIGVEISSYLSRLAAANVEVARQRLRCQDIQLVNTDVLDYRIPDDVTVVYAYNPFVGPVFEAAMQRLIASVDRRPRAVRLIYRHPCEHDRLVDTGRFKLVCAISGRRPARASARSAAIHIYELRPTARECDKKLR